MTYQSFSFGLLGENIGYSKSPDIFDAIFEVDDVNGTFELYDVRSDDLQTELPKIFQHLVGGLSVTIPYKQQVIPFLDEVEEPAAILDAVNSIAVRGKLVGYNTDWLGFAVSLRKVVEPIEPGFTLVLGSGGAARAALYALWKDFDFREFLIASRGPESLEESRQTLERILSDATLETALSEDLKPAGHTYRAVINATPLGGPNYPEESPLPPGFDWSQTEIYFDLNYNRDNQIVREAREAGVVALDGSAMLVAQALESYRLWTGHEVEFEPVYRRAFKV
jgi:shikimate dehydrogenase